MRRDKSRSIQASRGPVSSSYSLALFPAALCSPKLTDPDSPHKTAPIDQLALPRGCCRLRVEQGRLAAQSGRRRRCPYSPWATQDLDVG